MIGDKKIDLRNNDEIQRIWRELDFLRRRLTALEGGSGPYMFRQKITANLYLPNDDVPTDDEQALSKGAADALYEPLGGGSGSGAEDNSVLEAFGTGVVLSTSVLDVTGASVTLDRDGDWLLICTYTFVRDAGEDGISLFGHLDVNGTSYNNIVVYRGQSTDDATLTAPKVITGVTAGQIAKLQGQKGGGAGTSFIGTPCSIQAIWINP